MSYLWNPDYDEITGNVSPDSHDSASRPPEHVRRGHPTCTIYIRERPFSSWYFNEKVCHEFLSYRNSKNIYEELPLWTATEKSDIAEMLIKKRFVDCSKIVADKYWVIRIPGISQYEQNQPNSTVLTIWIKARWWWFKNRSDSISAIFWPIQDRKSVV